MRKVGSEQFQPIIQVSHGRRRPFPCLAGEAGCLLVLRSAELFGQCRPAAGQSRFDGARGRIGAVGDLVDRQVGEVVQEDDFPLRIGQRPNGQIEVDVAGVNIGAVERCGPIPAQQPVSQIAATPSATGDVQGHRADPGLGIGGALQGVALRVRLGESLLDDFFGVGDVSTGVGQNDQRQPKVGGLVQGLEPPRIVRGHAQLLTLSLGRRLRPTLTSLVAASRFHHWRHFPAADISSAIYGEAVESGRQLVDAASDQPHPDGRRGHDDDVVGVRGDPVVEGVQPHPGRVWRDGDVDLHDEVAAR